VNVVVFKQTTQDFCWIKQNCVSNLTSFVIINRMLWRAWKLLKLLTKYEYPADPKWNNRFPIYCCNIGEKLVNFRQSV